MEFNPIDKKEELLLFLEKLGVSAVLHSQADKDYKYLAEHDFCITVQNPYYESEHDLYIDMEDDGEFTVSFDMFHAHYFPHDTVYTQMLNVIQNILSGKAYAWTCYENDEWCQVSLGNDSEDRAKPPRKLKPNQRVECVYWNPEKNFMIKGEG